MYTENRSRKRTNYGQERPEGLQFDSPKIEGPIVQRSEDQHVAMHHRGLTISLVSVNITRFLEQQFLNLAVHPHQRNFEKCKLLGPIPKPLESEFLEVGTEPKLKNHKLLSQKIKVKRCGTVVWSHDYLTSPASSCTKEEWKH
jgi:hypothetical protein